MLKFADAEFVKSAYGVADLPPVQFPEIAFAGRSNVGKSSLINKLLNRRKLVKVSSRPGKTRCLNFFLVDKLLYLVDLPGYGFARVSRKMKNDWQGMSTSYILKRDSLACVGLIVDIRHGVKPQDLEFVNWLRAEGMSFLVVYTKADKITRSKRQQHAAKLDNGLGISPDNRLVFSAKSGEGRENLISALDRFAG